MDFPFDLLRIFINILGISFYLFGYVIFYIQRRHNHKGVTEDAKQMLLYTFGSLCFLFNNIIKFDILFFLVQLIIVIITFIAYRVVTRRKKEYEELTRIR